MQKTFETLYKIDSKGKTRVWYMEQNGDQYRTYDGLLEGNVKSSAFSTAIATNVGRANERNGVEQATAEIEAQYTKKLTAAYYRTIEETQQGCRFFEPMLAETYLHPKKPANKVAFGAGFAQPKLDGMRAIAKADGLWSRKGKIIPGTAHISEVLSPLFVADPTLMLDGEIYNHDLGEDFNELMSLAKKGNPSPERAEEIRTQVQFHVYDMPSHTGLFGDRSDILNDLLTELNAGGQTCVYDVETVVVDEKCEFNDLHDRWLAEGYEGSMLRRNAPYVNDRTYDLLKRKEFEDSEFDVVRIDQGDGNWAGAAKKVWCWLPGADRSKGPDFQNETNIFGAGLRGSYARNKTLLENADEQKVVTIRFFGFTPSAIPKPRFGVATKWHGAARVD